MPTSGPHRDQPLLPQAPSYVRDVDQAHAVLTARVADDERVNDPSWPRVVLVFDEAHLLAVRAEPQTRAQALTQLKLAEIARKGRYVGLATLPDLTRDSAITSPGALTFDVLRRTRPGQEQAAPHASTEQGQAR